MPCPRGRRRPRHRAAAGQTLSLARMCRVPACRRHGHCPAGAHQFRTGCCGRSCRRMHRRHCQCPGLLDLRRTLARTSGRPGCPRCPCPVAVRQIPTPGHTSARQAGRHRRLRLVAARQTAPLRRMPGRQPDRCHGPRRCPADQRRTLARTAGRPVDPLRHCSVAARQTRTSGHAPGHHAGRHRWLPRTGLHQTVPCLRAECRQIPRRHVQRLAVSRRSGCRPHLARRSSTRPFAGRQQCRCPARYRRRAAGELGSRPGRLRQPRPSGRQQRYAGLAPRHTRRAADRLVRRRDPDCARAPELPVGTHCCHQCGALIAPCRRGHGRRARRWRSARRRADRQCSAGRSADWLQSLRRHPDQQSWRHRHADRHHPGGRHADRHYSRGRHADQHPSGRRPARSQRRPYGPSPQRGRSRQQPPAARRCRAHGPLRGPLSRRARSRSRTSFHHERFQVRLPAASAT